jgi:tRNA-uridine 2-sulfurtransferase
MLIKTSDKPIVYLGLSGGVDSAVAAVLLQKQGYDVRGVFLKIWSDDLQGAGHCPWVQDRRDAIAIAAKIGIPVQTVSFEHEYKDKVFKYFVSEYEAGRTPNPDILCNEVIKFGVFLEWAIEQGADYIATGHHVRREPESGNNLDTEYKLLRGVDDVKDQTYFLSSLNQKQLARTLFPIGKHTKQEVRDLAKKYNLDSVADKPSTKGICFVGDVDLHQFLSQYTKSSAGDIVDTTGKVLGQHKGIAFYTIGQRKGLEVGAQTIDAKPYFVLQKNADTNELIVSNQEELLLKNSLICTDIHWISGATPKYPLSVKAKIRYNQTLEEANVSEHEPGTLRVEFTNPQRAIASGQIVAFYQDDVLLGSAIIA